MDPEVKEKLHKKLRNKREQRRNNRQTPPLPSIDTEQDFFKMMENVNKILKTNPQMIQQISNCMSNVLGNKDLMNTITGQLEKEIQDQTLQSSSDCESLEASSKESTQ